MSKAKRGNTPGEKERPAAAMAAPRVESVQVKQTSVLLIFPDLLDNDSHLAIITLLLQGQHQILKQNTLTLQQKDLVWFEQAKDRPFFNDFSQFITSRPILAVLVEKIDCILQLLNFVGPWDPVEAKKTAANSLRAKYGVDVVHCGTFCSTSVEQASLMRSRCFPSPVQVGTKVLSTSGNQSHMLDVTTVMRFVFPPHQEHADSAGRLDILALHGPTHELHSIESCFCSTCIRLLRQTFARPTHTRSELASTLESIHITDSGHESTVLESTAGSRESSLIRGCLLSADTLISSDVIRQLCKSCRSHVKHTVHLVSGREGRHILTDYEIKTMIEEVNHTDLLTSLQSKRGSAGVAVLASMVLPTMPPYSREDIPVFLSQLPRNEYDQFKFIDFQRLVLADRKERLKELEEYILSNGKPLKTKTGIAAQSPSRTLLEGSSKFASLRKTLNATSPTGTNNEKTLADRFETPIVTVGQVLDKKKKIKQTERFLVLHSKLNRHTQAVADLSEANKPEITQNVRLLRETAPVVGVGGHKWDNLACLQNTGKGSYVKSRNMPQNKLHGID